jgi:hypothetical protein
MREVRFVPLPFRRLAVQLSQLCDNRKHGTNGEFRNEYVELPTART